MLFLYVCTSRGHVSRNRKESFTFRCIFYILPRILFLLQLLLHRLLSPLCYKCNILSKMSGIILRKYISFVYYYHIHTYTCITLHSYSRLVFLNDYFLFSLFHHPHFRGSHKINKLFIQKKENRSLH